MLHRPMFLSRGLLAAGLLLGGAAASIERLDLRRMLEKSDGAVVGRIAESWTTWNESPGTAARVFTHLRIVGEDLATGERSERTVSYFGGQYRGVNQWHADMPTEADVRVGNRVVAFHKWLPTMGGVGMDGLYAAFGGLYRVEKGPRGEVVIGRGEGFAVEKNTALAELRTEVQRLRAEIGGRPR